MGNAKSLQDVMNEVSSGLDSGLFVMPAKPHSEGALTEMEAFRQLDPLLASLYKEYLNAKNIRLQAVREYGAGEAMTDMAQLVEDSAWCAMQTRYMEVRDDRALMGEAQAMMMESQRICEREEREKNEQQVLNFMAKVQMLQAMKERDDKARQRDESQLAVWVMAMLLFAPNSPFFFRPWQTSHQFNKLAA